MPSLLNVENDASKVVDLLHKVSEALSREEEISEVFTPVLMVMKDYLGLTRGMLTILNRENGAIFTEESFGMTEEEQARGVYRLGEGITGEVVETGKPVIVPDVAKDSRFLNKTGIGSDDQSFLCVPICYGKEVLGTLSAYRNKAGQETLETDQKILSIITPMIARAVRLHRSIHEENLKLRDENQRLHSQLLEQFHPDNIIGNAKGMRDVFYLIQKIAPTDTTTLILGESGVGKELVAHSIYAASYRTSGPFIRFNCAALPESMVESELFGHEKGAFTGAINKRLGRFMLAEGGTLFLDEVGELSLNVQTKLLRILQEHEFQPVGSDQSLTCDVRIVAATNKNLESLVQKGEFREDLYYRLNVFPITVPSLRDRKTDIPLLADFFIKKYSDKLGKNIRRISTAAIDMLMSYHWPGNVRELENCLERAVILADSDTIHGYDLPPTLQTSHPASTHFKGNLETTLDAIEYELIIEELKKANGNVSKASDVLGLSYRKLGLRLKKYDIDYRIYRNPNKD
ncbi:sigma-54-dependent Fis family transcriptional regulator [Spirochaeta cellobiosiphila]|uniref:sigma-54-dependent Fis family transcriptional regulator n=1 Tax=Spirochaeta cellobiosiphila TaxID=504483 RepID=UPI0003FC392E|nr:sigma-54-dependent Fis family transcriptional regulator [Spirochaeta cellobiosiphila]